MDAPVNAPLVGIADDFLDQLFRSVSFSWGDCSRDAMSLRFCFCERSASSAGGNAGFLLGFNFVESRMFAISEEVKGCENNFLEETDVKPITVGETLVHLLPTSMFLGFGHVQSHQIGPISPPKQVLHDQAAVEWEAQPPVPCPKVRVRVGRVTPDGTAERANVSKPTKLQVWEEIWSSYVNWTKIAKLMEEEIGKAMKFFQSKVFGKMPISTITSSHIQSSVSSTLKPPEPNAPL